MIKSKRPTAKQIRALYICDYATGRMFHAATRLGRGCRVGYETGWLHGNGRWYVQTPYGTYFRAHLVWLHYHGKWPSKKLDHKDTIRSNDNIKNLRLVNEYETNWNRKTFKNNTSGAKNVFRRGKRWWVGMGANGKTHEAGPFASFEEAVSVRDKMIKRLHGEFARV